MTRTFAVVSVPPTIRPLPRLSPSCAQCPCVSMKAGTKFNSTSLISLVALTVPTISRLCVYRCTLTAESDASTSPTDFTQRRSFRQNSSSICPYRRSKQKYPCRKLASDGETDREESERSACEIAVYSICPLIEEKGERFGRMVDDSYLFPRRIDVRPYIGIKG